MSKSTNAGISIVPPPIPIPPIRPAIIPINTNNIYTIILRAANTMNMENILRSQ